MTTDRWTEAEANRWSQARPWICGCNFLPSTAVNFIEMWHPETFDLPTIEQELGWAAETGFNAIRINLNWLGWVHDRDGLMDRLDRFMGTAHRLGILTVPCLFDDCGFGGQEPQWARQPDPVPGVHNSRAIASPGRATVMDSAAHPRLGAYVRDVIGSFRNDRRILFWDLYNEPGNRMEFHRQGFSTFPGALEGPAQALMQASFAWARAASPEQPLTVGAWTAAPGGAVGQSYTTDIDRSALALSDIISFHAYLDRASVAAIIDRLRGQNRPMFCTEWMARAVDSRIADQLSLFRGRGVGCFQWGFVRGRTQTHLPWPEALVAAHGGTARRDLWFHDLLDSDGAPYDPAEIDTIRRATRPAHPVA